MGRGNSQPILIRGGLREAADLDLRPAGGLAVEESTFDEEFPSVHLK